MGFSRKGYASVELRTGDKAYDISPFIHTFSWTESMLAGGWSWALVFSADQWTEWNDFLIGADKPFYLRLSTAVDDDTTSTEWKRAYPDNSRALFRGEAMRARVSGGDKRLEMLQKARTRAFKDSTVSDVLRKVAAEFDLTAVVEDTNAARDRWQLREADWAFLRRLAGQAATASGRGDAYLWLDETTLRFGAPALGALSERRHDMSTVENRVDRIAVSYQGRLVDRMAGATARGCGYDLDATSSAAKVFNLDGDQARTLPSLAKLVPRDPADGVRVFPVTESSAGLVEEATRATWGRAAPRYFSLRVDTRADLVLRPGVLVEVQVNLDERHETPFFGRFVVLEVRHAYNRGRLVTTATCFRREAFAGEAEPTGASASAAGTKDQFSLGDDEADVTLVAEDLDA